MFEIQTLGSIDLVYNPAASSGYFVVDTQADPDPKYEDIYVALRSAGGARFVSGSEAETDLPLAVIPFGSNLDEAEANRDALEVPLLAARNWRTTGIVTTYVEKDFLNAVAKTWRLVGGRVKPVSVLPGTQGKIFGLNGKFVAPCIVSLKLSKN